MFYLSERLGAEVVGANGDVVGRLSDVIVAGDADIVSAIVVKTDESHLELLSLGAEVTWSGKRLVVGTPETSESAYQTVDGDTWLARDVQDRRVVDTARAKLARVSAIVMSEGAEGWRVTGVEVGSRGLLVRMGLGRLADVLRLGQRVIAWQDAGMTEGPTDRLEQMHPAEIAAIVEELPPAQGSDLIEALDDEIAADTVEEVHPDRQADLLEDMPPERAADILEEMSPDNAADVLQDMTQEKAQELLGLMEDDEAAEAKELLAHPEDSAGGLMTTEYASLPPHLTAAQALEELPLRYTNELDHLYYVYITEADETVLGVLSVWDLLTARPDARLDAIMETRVVSVRPEVEAEEAARLISRYNILAIPVVDDDDRLLGVVTIDDAMDLLLPADWRGRPLESY